MDLKHLDLNLLLNLQALLNERSVTLAARQANLSQPAMSGSLARLRRVFNDQLLVRSGRQMHRTALGEQLKPKVDDLLRSVEQLLTLPGIFSPERLDWEIALGASDYSMATGLAELPGALYATAPLVRVRHLPIPFDIVRALEKRQLDFLVLPGAIVRGLVSAPLWYDDWVAMVWADHALAAQPLDVATFSAYPHIDLLPTQVGGQSLITTFLETAGIRRDVIADTRNYLAIPFMLMNTNLIAVLPRRLAILLNEGQQFKQLELPFSAPHFSMNLCWHPDDTGVPRQEWFIREVLAATAHLRRQR